MNYEKLMKNKKIIGIEEPMWYDGIAYYQDEKGNRYSRHWHKIDRSEMCKHWFIFEVIIVTEWPWPYDYHYEIMDARPDTIIIDNDKWSEVKSKYIYYNLWLYKKLYGK
jgi:hypothetical protein